MKIIYKKQAAKYVKALDKPTQRRIITAVESLPSGDIKRLQGYKELYRLRIGGYRAIFTYQASEIIILSIDTRGDIY